MTGEARIIWAALSIFFLLFGLWMLSGIAMGVAVFPWREV